MKSKWLTWTPQCQIIEKTVTKAPSKPPKVDLGQPTANFEGFEGAPPAIFPIFRKESEPKTFSDRGNENQTLDRKAEGDLVHHSAARPEAAISFSRWLDWAPAPPKLENTASSEPTKQAESTFDGAPRAISQYLSGAGDGPRVFPHCPRCASYALYRKNNHGAYQCETCGLADIPADVARRIQ